MASALALLGEKWTLLAIREIALGNHRFDAIARNTGAPRDRLAARLRSLEANGLVYRPLYNEHPPRHEYHLTEAGLEVRLVLQQLIIWGDRWAVGKPPAVFTHTCGHDLGPSLVCEHCGLDVGPDDLDYRMLAKGWDRSGPTAPAIR